MQAQLVPAAQSGDRTFTITVTGTNLVTALTNQVAIHLTRGAVDRLQLPVSANGTAVVETVSGPASQRTVRWQNVSTPDHSFSATTGMKGATVSLVGQPDLFGDDPVTDAYGYANTTELVSDQPSPAGAPGVQWEYDWSPDHNLYQELLSGGQGCALTPSPSADGHSTCYFYDGTNPNKLMNVYPRGWTSAIAYHLWERAVSQGRQVHPAANAVLFP